MTNEPDQVSSEWRVRVERKIDKMCLFLTGNGDPHKGLLIRVDRLEQRVSRTAWIQGAVVTAIISAGAGALVVTLLK